MLYLAFVMHASLAAIFPICRLAILVSDPLFFTAMRKIIAGGILLGYAWWLGQLSAIRFSRRFCILMAVVTIFGVYLTNVPECWAMQFVPSAKAAFLYSMSPFYASILAHVCFGEHLTIKKGVGMLIGLCGFIIMVAKDAPSEIHTGGFWLFSSGEIAMIIASVATVIGWMAVRQLVRQGFTSTEINGYTMVLGGLASLATSPFLEAWNPVPVSTQTLFWWYLALAILFSNLIGYTLYGYLLKRYSTTLLSYVGFSEIIFAAFYGWLFLGEALTWQLYASSACVLVGLSIFYAEELRQGYVLHHAGRE